MNTAAKGARLEHRSKRWLEAQGLTCTRSSASRGLWDLVAWSCLTIVFVQVRAGRFPGKAERIRLAKADVPPGAIRELHCWRPRAHRPEVLMWQRGEWRVAA